MQRTFVTNLLLLLVLNLLVKPFYILGIDAGVQDAVGSSTYGGYAALLSLSFLLNILLDLGITNYNTRHIAQHTHLMGKYFGGIVAVRVLLLGLYALITIGAALLLGYRGAELVMLAWLLLNQALATTILYLRSNIAGAQRFRQDSLLSVLDRGLLIAIVGWALWGRADGVPFRIEWFVWAQTAAYGFTALVALAMVLRLTGPVRWAVRPLVGWSVLRQSFPYALLILLMTFYYRTDMIMLERLLPDGARHAGIYAQGFRFFEAVNMLGYLFAGLLLPMFSRMLAKREDVRPLVGTSFRFVLAGALAVAVLASHHAQAIMDWRYADATESSAAAFALLIWCFVAVATTYIFGTLLTAAGDLKLLNRLAAGGALLNIVLNLWLIPRYQAVGAAWASLITQAGMAIAQMLLAAGRHSMPLPLKPMLRTLFYLAGAFAIVHAMDLVGIHGPLLWSLAGIALVMWAVIAGMFGSWQLLRTALQRHKG